MKPHGALFVVLTAIACRAAVPCEAAFYQGFDTRLTAEVIASIPSTSDRVVGFEVSSKAAIVAYPHRILAASTTGVAVLTSIEEIVGIAVDQNRELIVFTKAGARRIGTERLEPDNKQRVPSGRLLMNSGSPFFVWTTQDGNNSALFLSRSSKEIPFANLPGKLNAVSVGPQGLAATVGESLYVWDGGAAELLRLATDTGLAQSRDVSLTGPRSAVVALPKAVLLFTPDVQVVLVTMVARCRWSGGALYLLDVNRNVIWIVRGLDLLGTKTQDDDHVRRLITAVRNGSSSGPAFLEAARIVGCQQATAMLSKRH